MYSIDYSNRFKKDLRLCAKRGLQLKKIYEVVRLLSCNGTLPACYRPHKLSGKYSGLWECHIEADWLMVWEQNDSTFTLLLLKTGSHSDLF